MLNFFYLVVAVGLLSVGCLSKAPLADAGVIIGRGIDGVTLGDSRSHVTRILGHPSSISPPDWLYRSGLVGHVGFDAGWHVNSVATRSPHQRSSRGIGPGVSIRRVRTAYPGIRCYGQAVAGHQALCLLRTRLDGKVVETDFVFSVRLVEIAIYFA
jgi:hypothetical protein